jgi:tetratricopeptide (TPR) repeat protein
LWGLVNPYILRGELGRATGLIDRQFALAHEWQLGVWLNVLPWSSGRIHTLSGRATEGVSLLQESLRIYDARKLGNWQSLVIAHLAEALLLAGQPEDALASARRAVALARERGERGHQAYALRILGEIAAQSDSADVSEAALCYREALTLAGELGMRPLVAHCRLGVRRLYRRTGKREQAGEHLTIATSMYREMGMTYWLEQAEAEMRELG